MLCFGAVTVMPVASTGVIASQLQRFRTGPWPKVAALLTLMLALVFFWQAWSMSQRAHTGHHGAMPPTHSPSHQHHHYDT